MNYFESDDKERLFVFSKIVYYTLRKGELLISFLGDRWAIISEADEQERFIKEFKEYLSPQL